MQRQFRFQGMNRLGSCLVVLLLLVFGELQAKCTTQPLDSLLGVWHDESLELDTRLEAFNLCYSQFHGEFPDTLLHELDVLRNLGENVNRPLLVFEAYNRRGGILNYQGQNNLALKAYDDAQRIVADLKDTLRLGTVESNRGNVFAAQRKYIQALNHFSRALRFYEIAGYQRGQVNARMALGSMFTLLDDHALAMSYYQLIASELEVTEENEYFLALLNLNMGWCYYKFEEFEKAKELCLSALEVLQEYNSGFHVASCLANLARVQMALGELDDAITYVEASREKSKELGSNLDVLGCDLMEAEIELQANRPIQGLAIANRILEEIGSVDDVETRQNLYKVMYRAHKILGQSAHALDMYEQYQLYRDSVQSRKNNRLVDRVIYDKDLEHSMYILKMDAKLVQDREDILQLQIVLGFVLGFGVIISLLVSYIVRIKNDQLAKRHKLLNEIQKLKTDALNLGITNKPSDPLDRKLLEASLGRTLNDTDWKVLNILIENPTITNFEIAEQAHMSIDGIGSSLRRMYQYFDVKETKYKKIALLHTAFTKSKSGSTARG